MKRFQEAALVCAMCFALPLSASAVTIDTVPVGNPGNPDSVFGYGGVDYSYHIGTLEVTNSQYAEFLNVKAKSDPLDLYHSDMDSVSGINRGGITRSGSSGSYDYEVRPNMGDKPVTFVSWYDAMRFANWMHNGQGSGDTESGAYTLQGGTPTPTNSFPFYITRNPGATWFLPSEDEWFKAAFYDPRTEAQGGPSGDTHYWKYATQSDTLPTAATANSNGDIGNLGTNVANYAFHADWDDLNGHLTTVGSAGPLSASFYGTYDQAGNVAEWTVLPIGPNLQGGNWAQASFLLEASFPIGPIVGPEGWEELGYAYAGFRLATVPEPNTLVLAAMGLVGILLGLKRRRGKCTT